MTDDVRSFGATASSLARNPLGIIALFIVLVYGMAGLAFTFGGPESERRPLVWFLVIFPVLVLGVIAWLVAQHSRSLFGPADYKHEENYVRMQLSAVASLTAAAAKGGAVATEADLEQIVATVRSVGPSESRDDWQTLILWVDDRPENNAYERQAFEAMGLRFVLARSTSEALEALSSRSFAAIVSDMGRPEGADAGYILLDHLRRRGDSTPLYFYTSTRTPDQVLETRRRGGHGHTNDPRELFNMVIRAVIQGRGSAVTKL